MGVGRERFENLLPCHPLLQTDKRLCGLMDVASSFGSGDFGGFESHLGISEGLQLSKLGKKFLDAKFNVTLEA